MRTHMGITATEAEWSAAGFQTYSNSDEVRGPHNAEAGLLAARRALPEDAPGARILGEYIRSQRHDYQEATRSEAIRRLAASLANVGGTVHLDAAPLIAALDRLVR